MPIHVGISSWTDKSLVDSSMFYPKKSMKSSERLRFYSLFFDTTEVNASFYAFPSPSWLKNWIENTPPNFQFGVKAYSLLTFHPVHASGIPEELRDFLPKEIVEGLPASWRELSRVRISPSNFDEEAWDLAFTKFKESLYPLVETGKMAYVLFQFGFWWYFKPERLEYILQLPDKLEGFHIAVEFRHNSWLPKREELLIPLFRERGITLVSVDCPPSPKTIPSKLYVTHKKVVVRFHGRNLEAWERSLKPGSGVTVEERYNYDYSDEDLKNWVDEVKKIDEDHETYVQFNNNSRWYPASSGMRFNHLLGRGPSWDEFLRQFGKRLPK